MERVRLHNSREEASRRGVFFRRYRRTRVSGFLCDIADGHRLLGGIVEDISPNGFRMSQVSDAFVSGEHSYRTVVSGNGRHYRILAKPCWKRKVGSGFEIGFKILDVSWEWTELVLAADFQSQGDVVQGHA